MRSRSERSSSKGGFEGDETLSVSAFAGAEDGGRRLEEDGEGERRRAVRSRIDSEAMAILSPSERFGGDLDKVALLSAVALRSAEKGEDKRSWKEDRGGGDLERRRGEYPRLRLRLLLLVDLSRLLDLSLRLDLSRDDERRRILSREYELFRLGGERERVLYFSLSLERLLDLLESVFDGDLIMSRFRGLSAVLSANPVGRSLASICWRKLASFPLPLLSSTRGFADEDAEITAAEGLAAPCATLDERD